jgi:acetyl esterase/lipase
VAAINYRLSPPMHEDGNARERREAQSDRDVFPAQIEDCKAAVRWLRANADEHGIDASRIAAWGESAVLGRGGGAALPTGTREV